jgi:enoyl-CoA hydratase/carnithine racemase
VSGRAGFWEIPTINSFESGLEVWKPTIAAVNGYCLGYGLTTVARCDFVIASDRAEFGFPEVRLGVPTIVGAMRLPGRVGWSNAMEMLLTGERFGAERAYEMGLVWRVVPRGPDNGARRSRWCRPRLSPSAHEGDGRRSTHCRGRTPLRLGESMRRVVGATEDASEGCGPRTSGEPHWRGR